MAINLVYQEGRNDPSTDYQGLEDQEEKVAHPRKHSSVDLRREIKDAGLRHWLKEEQLEFLQKELYCLKYTDLRSITDDEVVALSTNLNTAQQMRFKNAINNLRTQYSTNKQRSRAPGHTRFDDIFKLILVGDCNVGKSSILNRFVKDQFDHTYETTIGLNCEDQIIEIPQKTVKLQIYDTSGAHQFGTISRAFFRDAHGALIIYDITNEQSFNNVSSWIERLGVCVDEKAWKMIIGNKCDLDNKRVITYQDGEQLSHEYAVKFMECSAKTGDHIDAIFSVASQYLLDAWWVKPKKRSDCCVLL
eukprot:20375_1